MHSGQRIIPVELPRWRNWQTRTLEGCVPQGVKVRILSEAQMEELPINFGSSFSFPRVLQGESRCCTLHFNSLTA